VEVVSHDAIRMQDPPAALGSLQQGLLEGLLGPIALENPTAVAAAVDDVIQPARPLEPSLPSNRIGKVAQRNAMSRVLD